MKIRTLALATAALSLAASPAIAQATLDRAIAPVSEESSEAAGTSGILIGIFAAAAVIGGIIVASDDDDPFSA